MVALLSALFISCLPPRPWWRPGSVCTLTQLWLQRCLQKYFQIQLFRGHVRSCLCKWTCHMDFPLYSLERNYRLFWTYLSFEEFLPKMCILQFSGKPRQSNKLFGILAIILFFHFLLNKILKSWKNTNIQSANFVLRVAAFKCFWSKIVSKKDT